MPKLRRRDTGEEIVLAEGTTRIGRRSANEVQLRQKAVSRFHCQIQGPAGGWTLSDQGSKLGTYVNGRRVRRHRLRAGDELKVGTVVFVFDEGGPTAAQGALPHLSPLTDTAAERILPEGEEDGEEEAAAGRRRRRAPVLVGLGVAVLCVGVLGAVLWMTRRTPEKAVRRAAALLRRRDGAALWGLLTHQRRLVMTEAEFAEQVDAVPNAVVEALESLEVGTARRTQEGMVVPVGVAAGDRRLEGEVVLYRQDGRWRVHAAPVEWVRELAP